MTRCSSDIHRRCRHDPRLAECIRNALHILRIWIFRGSRFRGKKNVHILRPDIPAIEYTVNNSSYRCRTPEPVIGAEFPQCESVLFRQIIIISGRHPYHIVRFIVSLISGQHKIPELPKYTSVASREYDFSVTHGVLTPVFHKRSYICEHGFSFVERNIIHMSVVQSKTSPARNILYKTDPDRSLPHHVVGPELRRIHVDRAVFQYDRIFIRIIS